MPPIGRFSLLPILARLTLGTVFATSLPEEFTWEKPKGSLIAPTPTIASATAYNVDGLLGFLAFTLEPPTGASAAAITLIVPGSAHGFVRAILQRGPDDAILLNPDLREHTGLPEQLCLLLPVEDLGPHATIEFHSSQPDNAFLRASVTWLRQETLHATPSPRPLRAALGADRLKRHDETHEGFPLSRPDLVLPRTVDAALHTPPIRVDEGVEFAFDLVTPPNLAAFRVEVAGVPLDEALDIWVNGYGPFPTTAAIPSLSDPGLIREGETWSYVGWRPLALLIPGDWLNPGENMIVLQRAQTVPGLPPLALKDARLEITRPTPPPAHEPNPLDPLIPQLTLPTP